MAREHLIPFNKMSKEKARSIQSKGGRTVSPQKKLAAKIREMKKRDISNEDVQHIIDMMKDSDYSFMYLLMVIHHFLEDEETTVNQTLRLINALLKWHKMRHGDASTQPKVIEVRPKLSKEEIEAELKRILERKEK
jgi:hypothetical protein